jgi:hypothetical protein
VSYANSSSPIDSAELLEDIYAQALEEKVPGSEFGIGTKENTILEEWGSPSSISESSMNTKVISYTDHDISFYIKNGILVRSDLKTDLSSLDAQCVDDFMESKGLHWIYCRSDRAAVMYEPLDREPREGLFFDFNKNTVIVGQISSIGNFLVN